MSVYALILYPIIYVKCIRKSDNTSELSVNEVSCTQVTIYCKVICL